MLFTEGRGSLPFPLRTAPDNSLGLAFIMISTCGLAPFYILIVIRHKH